MSDPIKKDETRGTYYFVIENGVDPATGKRRRIKRRGFSTKKEARDTLKLILAESVDGDYVKPSSQSVRVYLEKWLMRVEVKRKASTHAMYAHKLRRYVIPRIGALPISALDPSTLDALYAELQQRGGRPDKDGNPTPLSEQTVAVVHRILHRAFADAVTRGLIRHNPASDADSPRSTAPREREAWNSDELRTFFEHVAEDRLRALWVLAGTTGLRRGELCGLKWSDIRLDAGQLAVMRSRVPVSGRNIVETTPKSGRERIVALAPTTITALRAHRRHQLEDRLAWGTAWQDTGYVFTAEDGTPLRPDAVTQAFNDHVAAAGLRRIVFHGLRHSHITLGLAAGVPVKVMQERAGHAKVETTLAYTHVLSGMQERAAETVERAIFGD
jgi:integrase